MSKENQSDESVNYCVHCGAAVKKNQMYCPECGKLVLKLTPKTIEKTKEIHSAKPKAKEISRKCSGCGSIITSNILEQCPICNTVLEKLPESVTQPSLGRQGLIFMDKKFQPADKYVLKKDTWKLREAFNVFGNCILFYIIAQIGIFILLSVLAPETTMISIIISQIPTLFYGIYPLYYIRSNNHKFEKIGYSYSKKKLIIAIALGIVGAISILLFTIVSSSFENFLYQIGIKLVDIQVYEAQETQLLQNADFLSLMVFSALIVLGSISVEILFRGVLQNALKSKYGTTLNGRFTSILLTSLVYTLLYLILSFPIGLYLLLFNFVFSFILGILYEVNGNIMNTMIGNALYNVLLLIIIVFF